MTRASTGRPDPPDGRLRRRLLANVRVLPSGTSLRFAILVVMIVASTGSVYSHLAILAQPDIDAAYERCMSVPAPPIPESFGDLSPNRALECSLPFAQIIAYSSLSGIALVIVLSLVIYLFTPRWKLRGGHWTPLGTAIEGGWAYRSWWMPTGKLKQGTPEAALAVARLDELADRYGLRRDRDVKFLVDWRRQKYSDARTFGTRRRAFVSLDAGLFLTFAKQPDRFTSIVLHELAHVHNRDNRPTYLTLTTWRAFVAVVLTPYLILSVEPRLIGALSSGRLHQLRPRLPELQVMAAVAVLTAVVYLSRQAVARMRETHADAVAGCHDPGETVMASLRRAQPERGPVLVRDHPTPQQRIAAMQEPALLYTLEPFVLFSTGVALGLFAINTTYLVTLASLSSWLGDQTASGRIADAILGRVPTAEAMRLPVLLIGPTTLLTLAMISWLAAVAGWQAALAGSGGASTPRTPLRRLALPLAAGLMAGEPLSIIYANAATFGLFGSTPARQAVDVAVSAVVLAILVFTLFLWARECAKVWLPVTRGRLGRMCAITAAVGTLGGFSVFLIWFVAHNTSGITRFDIPAALPHTLADFPAARLLLGSYSAIDFLPSLPGNAVLLALPCLLVAYGAIRRPPSGPPAWLPAEFAVLAPAIRASRTRVRAGRAVLIGVAAGVLVFELSFVLVELLRTVVGARHVVTTVLVGGVVYIGKALIAMTALGAATAACYSARTGGGARFATGLLTAFVTAAVATVLMPFAHFAATCETLSYACLTTQVYGTTYGGLAAMGTVNSAILAVLVLLAGRALARLRPAEPKAAPLAAVDPPQLTATGRLGVAAALCLTVASLAVGSWVFSSYYL